MLEIGTTQLEYYKERTKSGQYLWKYACVKAACEWIAATHSIYSIGDYFAGFGIYAKVLRKIFPAARYVGYELNTEVCKIFRKNCSGVPIIQANAFTRSNYPEDLIICDANKCTLRLLTVYTPILQARKITLLTETGIFGLKLPSFQTCYSLQDATPEGYYKRYAQVLRKYSLYLRFVSYCRWCSILAISPAHGSLELHKAAKLTDPVWQRLLEIE